jgi:hypothetical protein
LADKTKEVRFWCGDPKTGFGDLLSLFSLWWARQPPYEAAFLEGFLGLIKMLIQRVPTKIPTKLPRGRRSAAGVQSPAALWSSIASDRTMKVARSLSVGECIFEVGPARAGRLSVPRAGSSYQVVKNWLVMG